MAQGGGVEVIEAWGGGLAYALRMCFDRSGHSDVATKLGLLFGIALPANLNSPARPETS